MDDDLLPPLPRVRASSVPAPVPGRERRRTVTDPTGCFTVRVPRAAAGRYRFAWLGDGRRLASAPAVPKR